MTAQSSDQNQQNRDRLLSHAVGTLRNLGRDASAKVMERYLRPDLTDPAAQTAFGVRARFQSPTARCQIAERLHLTASGPRWRASGTIMGIVRDETAQQMRSQLINVELPFDGYDRALAEGAPDTLVIEANALAQKFGWQHALTLRDPAATVELATMVQKARAAGIKVILIRPQDGHRFPLLSRIVELFDHVVNSPQELTERYLT